MLLKTPGSLVTRSFGWRPKKEQSVSQFFRIFWPLFLARLGRLRDNRRMTDAAHNQHSENQHSETRCPSDRDRIVTTGPSRFQPARPEVLPEMMSVSVAGIPKIVVGQQ